MRGDEVKPIARLHLRRERVVPKACVEEPMFDPSDNTDPVLDARCKCLPTDSNYSDFEKISLNHMTITILVECATTNFTDWSPCSTTCGKGLQARTRNYVNPQAAKKAGCNIQLMSKNFCVAPVSCP